LFRENEIWIEILVQMEILQENLHSAILHHFVVQGLVGLRHCQTWLFSLEKQKKINVVYEPRLSIYERLWLSHSDQARAQLVEKERLD
jgi:hypothetical protein